MKNLNPHYTNSNALYQKIISVRRDFELRTRLTQAMPQVKGRIEVYEQNTLSLTSINLVNWDNQTKKDLKTFFEKNCSITDEIKATIKKQAPRVCQYCEISEVDPLDHYLPISKFPEYSFLTLNLIPCCQICNKNKGDKWVDDKGIRTIINLYFDPVDKERFLYCGIEYSDSVPVPQFSLNTERTPSELAKIFKSHFLRLELLDRYKNMSNEVISSALISIRSNNLINKNTIRKSLSIQAGMLRKKYGNNNWKAAIYEALSESKDFLSSCRSL